MIALPRDVYWGYFFESNIYYFLEKEHSKNIINIAKKYPRAYSGAKTNKYIEQ